ncbi:hypothetical protein QNI22_40345, partial [Cytophagaceae bacterium BD1B2-1]|nr:hypothetical protein [Xanthocytophaga agilis]
TIQSGAKVTLNSGSELQVCGDLLNSGTLTTNSTATITMMGTTNQTISGSSSSSQYANLKVNKNSGYVIPANTIYVSNTLDLTKGLIKTGTYEINLTNSDTDAITNFSSASYIWGNLRRSIGTVPTVTVPNAGFENYGSGSSPANWTRTSNRSYLDNVNTPHSGSRYLAQYNGSSYTTEIYQTLSGLTNGIYTLKAWVISTGGQTSTYMYASNYGGSLIKTDITFSLTWKQITIPNIVVTNGQCRIGFYSSSSGGKYILADDVEFVYTGSIDYDYPIGDAGRYQRLTMGVTSDLNVSNVLGFFTWGTLSGTSGLPLVEGLNVFPYLAQDGYWTLEPNTTPAASARYNITLYLANYPGGSGPLTFAKRTNASSPWTFNNSSVVGDYSIKQQYGRSGFSTFSQIGIISGTPVSLPVTYLSLNGYATEEKQVELKWITSSEENSSMFNVERSSDGKTYTQLGSVVAAGNSSTPLTYSFLDSSPLSGVNYYRLNQIDRDGNGSYSKVVTVKIGQSSG